ncbi:MAG: alpha/beta hydrolase [Acidimicrobiales bacterium]|nr:alpha/beta hydrolase [Acidimicrobiales bacterium]
MSDRRPATLVLVHGAWHGAWCWDLLRDELAGLGVASVAPDLPSTASGGALSDDVATVRQALDSVDGPAVLVGHSRGGFVIAEAGDHPAVTHLVFLAAPMNAPDEPPHDMAQWAPAGSAEALVALYASTDLDEHGRRVIRPDAAGGLFYHDCPAELADAATARLRPQPTSGFEQHVYAWRDRPTTYIVCTDDRALHVPLQRYFAARASTGMATIASSHSPFMSRPAELAAVLAGVARAG